MSARYAAGTVHFHNTVTGKDETVQAGALKDSATQAAIQVPSQFQTTPLTNLPPATITYLQNRTAGP